MRFMLIVRANQASENGVFPAKERAQAMDQFTDDMLRAGVLLAREGLQASSEGARITFSAGARSLREGPFETRELICAFWLIQVRSRAEALEWARRCPFSDGEELEIRRLVETCDSSAQRRGPAART
jgi:hypothetical protein